MTGFVLHFRMPQALRGFIMLAAIGACSFNNKTSAQTITRRDTTNINLFAAATLTGLNDLMNLITNDQTGPGEFDEAVKVSFTEEGRRIFLNNQFLVENDLDPEIHSHDKAQEVPVNSYLNDLNLMYQKSDNSSIVFNIRQYSALKRGDSSLYMKVHYTETFQNKNSSKNLPYTTNDRVAELRVDKTGKKWHTVIVRLGFYDPQLFVADSTNNVPLQDDAAKTPENTAANAEADEAAKEVIREQSLYATLIDKGSVAFAADDDAAAYLSFREARRLRPFAIEPITKMKAIDKKIEATGKPVNDYYYDAFTKRAQLAERQRNLEEATESYRIAMERKPSESANIQKTLDALTEKYRTRTRLEELYNAGQYSKALDGYTAALKEDDKNSDYYLGRAKSYDRLGKPKNAIKDYNMAVSSDGNNLQALRARADFHKAQKEYIDALTDYKLYLTLDKYNPDVYADIASVYMETGNNKAALEQLDEALKINPGSPELYYNKGLIYYRTGDNASAMDNFTRALSKSPNFALALYYKGAVYVQQGFVPKASESFTAARAAGLPASYDDSMARFSVRYYTDYMAAKPDIVKENNKGAAEAGRKLIDNAIALNPLAANYYFERGEMDMAEQDYWQAIADYTKALEVNDRYAEAFTRRGYANIGRGNYEKAVSDFNEALRQIPPAGKGGNSDAMALAALQGKGEAYAAWGKNSEAVRVYEEAVDRLRNAKNSGLTPTQEAAFYNSLAHAYYQQGDMEKAALNVKRAIDENADFADAYYNRGMIAFSTGKLNDARDDIFKALSYNRDQPRWNYDLGGVFLRQGAYDQAIRCYNITLAHNENNQLPKAVYYRGLCYAKTADYNKAAKDYRTAIQLKLDEDIPTFYNELGYVFVNQGKLDSAVHYFQVSFDANNNDAMASYGMGTALYMQGKKDDSYAWFEKAFSKDKIEKSYIKADPLLEHARDEDKFKQLMKKYY